MNTQNKRVGITTIPFFELRADEGCHDKINSISFNIDSLVLKIDRESQEGWNEFNVLIQLDSSVILPHTLILENGFMNKKSNKSSWKYIYMRL